jgi:hypothetical protein
MPDPIIEQTLSEPETVQNFSAPDLNAYEIDIDEETPNHWGPIGPDEFANFGLDPCALIVFRSTQTDEIHAGHFYEVLLAPDNFHQMIDAMVEKFPDKLKVRVDCLGVSNRTEVEATGALDGSTARKRQHITETLRENGFDNVNTYWTEGGKVASVQIIGASKQIEVMQQHPDEVGDEDVDNY